MPTETVTPARFAATAADLYLGWVDASLTANERMARVARAWLDESLGLQQDMAETLKKAVGEARSVYTAETPASAPAAFTRAGDVARTTYYLFTENSLKAQERFGRVAQTAFAEMQQAQTDLTARMEERMNGVRAAAR